MEFPLNNTLQQLNSSLKKQITELNEIIKELENSKKLQISIK